MANYNCNACNNLRENAPDFVVNGLGSDEILSLKNNTGLNPEAGDDDCTALSDINDCLIGGLIDEVESFDSCGWKPFMRKFLPNLWTTISALIPAICGIWEYIVSGAIPRYLVLEGVKTDVEGLLEVDLQIPQTTLEQYGITPDMIVVAVQQGWTSQRATKTPRFATGIFEVRANPVRETATVYPSVYWLNGDELHIKLFNSSSNMQDVYYRIVFLDATNLPTVPVIT